ncbi:hypothetical protein LZC95_06745 [Pendulispora brunnea]|uniref:Knr4/Smi1-like domain-containing protein n=1 Tax=Pendulispora brunnea TaxID=2905690 RepID=A0ABZ2KCZ4_9BACT
MTKVEEWIAARIAECSPSGTRGDVGAGELVRALGFFRGDARQIFGMMGNRTQMPELATLQAACEAAIRGWYDEFGRTAPALQADLYEFCERNPRLALDLAEPSWLTEQRAKVGALEIERDAKLSQYGCPSDALSVWPGLQEGLSELRALGARVSFEAVMPHVGLPRELDMSNFEWYADDWASIGEARFEPAFYPIAGADGDAFGLLIDMSLASQGIPAPLVYYFHEHDPVYTWVFESCATAVEVFTSAAEKQAKRRGMGGSQARGRDDASRRDERFPRTKGITDPHGIMASAPPDGPKRAGGGRVRESR